MARAREWERRDWVQRSAHARLIYIATGLPYGQVLTCARVCACPVIAGPGSTGLRAGVHCATDRHCRRWNGHVLRSWQIEVQVRDVPLCWGSVWGLACLMVETLSCQIWSMGGRSSYI